MQNAILLACLASTNCGRRASNAIERLRALTSAIGQKPLSTCDQFTNLALLAEVAQSSRQVNTSSTQTAGNALSRFLLAHSLAAMFNPCASHHMFLDGWSRLDRYFPVTRTHDEFMPSLKKPRDFGCSKLSSVTCTKLVVHARAQTSMKEGLQPDSSAKKAPELRQKVIVLIPGSFSPVQTSHLLAAAAAGRAVESEGGFELHSIALSPVNDAYGKKGLLSAACRLDLLNLAIRSKALEESLGIQRNIYERLVVDTWESDQPSFQTTDLVARQLASYKGEDYMGMGKADVVMMAGGADFFSGMFATETSPSMTWIWAADEVAHLLNILDGIIVVQRPGSEAWSRDSIRDKLAAKLEGFAISQQLRDGEYTVIVAEDEAGSGSSTQVRELISNPPASEKVLCSQLEDLVVPEVAEQLMADARSLKEYWGTG